MNDYTFRHESTQASLTIGAETREEALKLLEQTLHNAGHWILEEEQPAEEYGICLQCGCEDRVPKPGCNCIMCHGGRSA